MQAILALDQGTTNTKAVLVDAQGNVVARASAPVGITFPRAGWAEQDADEMWRSTLTAARECLAGADGFAPVALALSSQRESVVGWDRATGRAVGPAWGTAVARSRGHAIDSDR